MLRKLKKTAYQILGLKNYLRLMQTGFYLAYKTGILKNSEEYKYHYFDRKLIKKGDTIIDIGANLGYYSILFSRWTEKNGKVYAVEPIKLYNEVFDKFTRRCSNIILLPYALGKEEKSTCLVMSSQSGYFSTGLPHVFDPDRDGNIDQQDYKFEAEMKTPYKLFEDLDKIDFIKCDIEGMEYTVLSDMKNLIAQHRPKVQVEVWGHNEELISDFFEELGYTAYKLKDGRLIANNSQFKTISGDFLFIHKNEKIDPSLLSSV